MNVAPTRQDAKEQGVETPSSVADQANQIVHLSSIVKRPLLDPGGHRLGRIVDLIVRLGEGRAHPPVTGMVAKVGRRELFVPIGLVSAIRPGEVRLSGDTLNLRKFERRPGELLLAGDLKTHHLINLVGARLIRAREIEIACVDGRWEVVGADPSTPSLLSWLLARAGSRGERNDHPNQMVDWASIEPFVSHVPTAHLRIPFRKLAHLHPAQIADLVEAASHDEGEEIIEAVREDAELEADVFEELDSEEQLEFLASRPDVEVGLLLAAMAPDNAADLLVNLDQERRLPLLDALPASQRAKVLALLSYHPETAGGLMSPDFACLPEATSAVKVLEELKNSSAPPEALTVIYGHDSEGKVSCAVPVVGLIQAEPGATLGQLSQADPVMIPADADIHTIVRKMADFNMSVAPVIDSDRHIIGVITVDDVLEHLLPAGWRRDFGMTSNEQ
ncbi:MAG: CBS domain-containing protein [Actinomycetota bacterium]|nr:CBS domain-containing protein [Actinomycetota bacterium]